MPDAACEQLAALRAYLDELGVALLFVDDGWVVTGGNRRFSDLHGAPGGGLGRPLGELVSGDDFQPPTSADSPRSHVTLTFSRAGGETESLRFRVFALAEGYALLSEKTLFVSSEAMAVMSRLNAELAEMTREVQRKNAELERAMGEIRTLRGILPICSSCKKIRDEEGYWRQVEEYVQHHTDAEFSHGLCLDCTLKLYPELAEDEEFRRRLG